MSRVVIRDLREPNAVLPTRDQLRHEHVSMLAHDIRGLVGAVTNAVEMARADLDGLPDRDAHHFLEIAQRNAAELVGLLTNLLDTYRLDEGRLRPRREPVDLAEVASDVVERLSGLARYRNVRLEVVGGPGGNVWGDEGLIDRVLLNLIGNALKFASAGGLVTIDLDADLEPPKGQAGRVIAVRDDGPGIAPADRAHLFERFTPLALPCGRRPVGSGLGLAFCKQVVELMGGAIWLANESRSGSTFAIVLPAACPEAGGEAPPLAHPRAASTMAAR